MTYTYDQVTLSGTATNGTGRLTTTTDSAGSRAFFYDALGRTIRTDQTVSGTVYTTQRTFDGIGRRTAVTYPNSLVVKYDYNGGPWLRLVYEGPTAQNPTLAYAQYVGYIAVGQPGSVTFGNGVTTNVTYSQGSNPTCPPATLWLCTRQTTQGTTILQTLTYGYDLAGNVTSLTDPLHGTQTFGYDGLDRLTSATGPWGSHPYTYLPNGNLQTNPLLGTYTYHALTQPGNRPLPHGVKNTGIGQPDFTYDDNGHLTAGAGRALTYDFENRLRSVTVGPATTTLGVDGDGNRVTQTVTVGGTSRTTTYIGDLSVCEGTGTGTCCVNYIFVGDQRIAAKRTDTGAVTYMHPDHLGSTSVVTDGSGNKIEALAYYPFGATRANTPGTAGSPLTDTPYKYTGQEYDSYTGLYYYKARYYAPVLARFIQPDTVVPDVYTPQALNPYSYVVNNPLRYTDPSGYQAGEFCECSITPQVAADLLNSLVQLGVQNRAQPFQASAALYSFVTQATLSNPAPPPQSGITSYRPAAFPPATIGERIEQTAQFLAAGPPIVAGVSQFSRFAPFFQRLIQPLLGLFERARVSSSVVSVVPRGIRITERGLSHVIERHLPGGSRVTPNKSIFFHGENIESLVQQAESVAPRRQAGGNLERIVDAGRTIGIDRATGRPTSTYTIITNTEGELVTAFPGRP